MTGTKPGLVVQPRDVALLRELSHLRVIDREDVRSVAEFHSRTRANTRLLTLVQAGLLVRKAAGTVQGGHKYLYALAPRGAQLIGVPYRAPLWNPHATLAWNASLEHQLALNRVYVTLKHSAVPQRGRLVRWSTFHQPMSPSIPLMPDAYLELETSATTRALFLEVDRGTETRRIWHRKVAAYLTLATSGEFSTRFQHQQFRVAVVAPSPRRLHTLRTVVATQTDKVFWFASPSAESRTWFWDRVWLRPRGDDTHFLI